MFKFFSIKKKIKKILMLALSIIIMMTIFHFWQNTDIKYMTNTRKYKNSNQKNLFNRCSNILFDKGAFYIKNIIRNDTSNNQVKMVYGVFLKTFNDLNEKLQNEFGEICVLNHFTVTHLKRITGIIIECKEFLVQISVFYRRKNFYWIGFADKKFEFFGDINRALNV